MPPAALMPVSYTHLDVYKRQAKRKAIIAGNWKMNKTATEAAELIDALIPAVKDADCEVVICTPFTSLVTAVEKCKGCLLYTSRCV